MAGSDSRPMARSTMIWLGVLFAAALLLRVVFNMGVAYDADQERYLYSGNDPWYHDRAVEHILATGESLTTDPGIAYPEGGNNPNPPLFDWTTALDAKIFEMAGASDPVGLALNLSVGFWGALTILPVFMLAATLFNRRAGLWAAGLMAVSAPHIQRTVFGFADHDAPTMFFIVLSFAFLVKALSVLRQREYVSSWSDGAMEGIRTAVDENRAALLWAALSGTALAATALTWKGYPYALAVFAVAFGTQLILDHVRNKDSTAISLLYLVPVVLTLIVSLPYYTALGFGDTTLMPNLYVLIGMLIVGGILVPTRKLPSIVVFPGLILAAALGLVIVLLALPEVGRTIFTGLGYFEQTKLYTTIAEAQRTELGFVAANFGFFTFLLGLWGFGRVLRLGWKGDAPMLLMASWAAVAGYMAFAASRFVMNAAPVFAILSGAMIAWALGKAGFDEMARRQRSMHGQNPIASFFKSFTSKTTTAVVLVGVLLVLPNAWLGVDAALSSEFEDENNLSDSRLGAFGISFDLKRNGWLEAFDHLATLDQDMEFEDRPAFIAWWDYGHWATAIGQHPTVADPFQSHYAYAGRFLASESEEEATAWLIALLLDGERKSKGALSDETEAALAKHGIDAADYKGSVDARFEVIVAEDIFALYDDVSEATGKFVGYMGVDSRMYPISQFQPGIFYAPAYLANKNPDEFISFTYQGSGLNLQVEQYGVDENGNSYRHSTPHFVDGAGDRWTVAGGQAYRGTDTLAISQQTGVSVSPNMQPSQRFFDSMYARAFGSPSAAQPAGDGLNHWRVIHDSVGESQGFEFRSATLLQYYKGHTVSGKVVDESGDPMVGVAVTFVDEFGAAHHGNFTDETGAFEVIAPFGDLQLTVRAGARDIYSEPWSFTVEEADGGSTDGVTVEVPFADLEGRVFRDLDGDGRWSDADEPVQGAAVRAGDNTASTNADGMYNFTNIPAGAYTLSSTLAGYDDATAFAVAYADETGVGNITMVAKPSTVNVTFEDDGQGIVGVPIDFDGPTTIQVTSGVNGTSSIVLQPGTYEVTVDHSFVKDGVEVDYMVTETIEIPFGGEDFAFTLRPE